MRRRAHRADPHPEPAEVEGYLEGVRHRLAHTDPERRRRLAPALEVAVDLLRAGDTAGTMRELQAIDDELLDEEPELTELPRGLVGYVPKGGAGVPISEDEDPLRNRLILLGRIATILARGGRDCTGAIQELTEADAALGRGERGEARARGTAAQVLLEAVARSSSQP